MFFIKLLKVAEKARTVGLYGLFIFNEEIYTAICSQAGGTPLEGSETTGEVKSS